MSVSTLPSHSHMHDCAFTCASIKFAAADLHKAGRQQAAELLDACARVQNL